MKDSLEKAKYIEKEKLSEFIKELQKEFIVIGPTKVKNKEFVKFKELKDGDVPYMDYLNSRQPPKEFLLPQTEKIIDFEGDIDKRVPEDKEKKVKKRILFGIRPCDVNSILILDKVFINEDYVDNYYKNLRDDSLIFGYGCLKPRTTCFCLSFGSGPFSKEGSDVFITDLGDKYLIEGLNSQGIKTIDSLQDADEEMLKEKEKLAKQAEKEINSVKDIEQIPEKLRKMFENPIWEKISERCLGCGICTYLCPTCHCFDIQDEVIDEKGRRIRNWDSCMFPIFTLHGSGHQPREFRYQRMRQRIMHKFNYYQENFGVIACCGCGRCVTECPVNIDVRETLEEIKKNKLTVGKGNK